MGGSGREIDGAGLGEGRSESRDDLRILDVGRLAGRKCEKLNVWLLLKKTNRSEPDDHWAEARLRRGLTVYEQ